jgi:hypothetical protein
MHSYMRTCCESQYKIFSLLRNAEDYTGCAARVTLTARNTYLTLLRGFLSAVTICLTRVRCKELSLRYKLRGP